MSGIMDKKEWVKNVDPHTLLYRTKWFQLEFQAKNVGASKAEQFKNIQ
jgi:hypothetical protein